MLRRNLKHQLRYPSLTLMLVGCRSCSCCCSSTSSAASSAPGSAPRRRRDAGRDGYLNYLMPGILLMTVAAAAQGTAIVVAMDMTEGIIDRFRTMAIAALRGAHRPRARQPDPDARSASASCIAVALALGFRPDAGPLDWLAADRRPGAVRVRASSGSPPRSASPPRASRPPATRRCSSPCCPSSAAASSRPRHAGRAAPVRRVPALHPGHRDRCADCSPARRSARTPSPPSPGASGSPAGSYLWARHLYAQRRSS